MKGAQRAGLVVLAVLVAAALVVTIGIPAGWMTAAIEQRIARDTGARLTLHGVTRLALWPTPRVTATDIVIERAGSDATKLSIGSIEAELPFASLLSGEPQFSEVTLTRPELRLPLLRERQTVPAATPAAAIVLGRVPFDRLHVVQGAIVLASAEDHVEQRIDQIVADITTAADRRIDIAGSADLASKAISFAISTVMPNDTGARPTVPIDLSLTAPRLLSAPLRAKAELRLNGAVLMINGLSGTLGDDAFNGWASADVSTKPQLKLDLDFQRLAFASARPFTATAGAPWSDAPINLIGLNYFDAEARLSAGELIIGDTHIAPASFGATLSRGVVSAKFLNLGAYGGQANGELSIDARAGAPKTALRADIDGVRALPLLSTLAGFDRIDGVMQARLDLRSAGDNARAQIGALGGAATVEFRDGEIRGVNVARMIRALASGSLAGWQDNTTDATDLSRLTASFRIEQGQAATSDLAMAGPLVRMTGGGSFDLPNQALAFRVEPKLVLTTQGQGGAGNPIGLGVPVMVEGPWAEPRIHLDVAGILDDPDGTYARLRRLGQGLFGKDGDLNGLGETLGNMIQQGLGARPRPAPDAPQRPDNDTSVDTIMKQLFGR